MRVALLLALTFTAHAQWEIQNSGTKADLRGIASAGKGIAWASGTNGTVLRTEDGGYLWQRCTTPPGAETLDFRGVQAFDANTAIVMSSGKGDLSRLYKTTDGCQTWKLVFTNPDRDGFWDAIQMAPLPQEHKGRPPTYAGLVIGDPVHRHFPEFYSTDDGEHWSKADDFGAPAAEEGEAIFAASNSALLYSPDKGELFVTGDFLGGRSRVLTKSVKQASRATLKYDGGRIPLAANRESTGAFSVAIAPLDDNAPNTDPSDPTTVLLITKGVLVAVGGDYAKPERTNGTAAFSLDSGMHWSAATVTPNGYRSAVAYDASTRTWIAVGPNGTDISTDNGRNWRALQPLAGEAPDTAQHWNALSLPFVVGPKGRIGVLEPASLRAK